MKVGTIHWSVFWIWFIILCLIIFIVKNLCMVLHMSVQILYFLPKKRIPWKLVYRHYWIKYSCTGDTWEHFSELLFWQPRGIVTLSVLFFFVCFKWSVADYFTVLIFKRFSYQYLFLSLWHSDRWRTKAVLINGAFVSNGSGSFQDINILMRI